MDLNGHDIIIERAIGRDAILEGVRSFWPQMTVEDLDDETEFCIYKDAAAQAAWEEEGWSEANDPLLIAVICGESETTFVIDNKKENEYIIRHVTGQDGW